MLEDLGPSFVKIGQTLSTRSEILPKAYCDELAKLQMECDPLPEGAEAVPTHLALRAADAAAVAAFYEAALAAGGTDNGAPGPRDYHPGYYAAFVYDPEGNNIEAVIHDWSE